MLKSLPRESNTIQLPHSYNKKLIIKESTYNMGTQLRADNQLTNYYLSSSTKYRSFIGKSLKHVLKPPNYSITYFKK